MKRIESEETRVRRWREEVDGEMKSSMAIDFDSQKEWKTNEAKADRDNVLKENNVPALHCLAARKWQRIL